MSAENKVLARMLFDEVWNKRNLGLADELIASTFVNHDPSSPSVAPGPEAEKQLVGIYVAAFPDLAFVIEDLISEEDRVVVRWTATGTQRGELTGIAATDRAMGVSGVTILRFSAGKIAEAWTNWDALGLMQQLGVVGSQAA